MYNSDNISRICPGKKDCRKIKGITYQKRMLLYNIREIFNIFVDEYKLKYEIDQYDNLNKPLGSEKCVELKPKYCISVNSSGIS